eukprot:12303386-Ditylum_brightwellii.AAC.1
MSSCAKQIPINQQHPGKVSWRLWRKAMTIWTLGLKLKAPLGKWYTYGDAQEHIWPSYHDFIDGHFHVKALDKYIEYSKNSKNDFITGKYVSWQLTESSAPFYVETTDVSELWYGPYCHGMVGELHKPRISMFDSYIDSLERWEREILSDVDMVYSCHELRDMLDDGHMLIATDGSAGDDNMSFAWKICNKDEKTLIQHAGLAFGKESLFWSEAYG